MAKSLDFSDLGATEVASPAMDFSDLGAEKVGGKQGPEISKLDSALAGAQQGTTLGFGDEIQGAIPAGLDKVQELLNKLGIANPSPTQVNAQMASQGVTGDTGPASTLAMYQQMRDQARQKNEAAQAANPMSYMGGNIAGGVLPAVIAPAGFMAPIGQAVKGAGLATKMGTAALNSVPLGATISAGMSNSDLTSGTSDDALNFGNDVLNGTMTGAGIGAALPAVGAGLSAGARGIGAVGGKLIPENAKHAFNRGLEGIDTKSQQFYDDVTSRLKNITDKIGAPLADKSKTQQAAAQAEVDTLEHQLAITTDRAKVAIESGKTNEVAIHEAKINEIQSKLAALKGSTEDAVKKGEQIQAQENSSNIVNLDNKLMNVQDETAKMSELDTQRQLAQNAQEIHKINSDTVNVAKNIQNRIFDVKKELGKQYDKIDTAAEATGIVPENRDVIGKFEQTLMNNSGMSEGEISSIMKKLIPSLGKKDVQSFRNVKGTLNNYFEHANPVVRRAAKDAYAQLKNGYANDLTEGGYGALAKELSETNKRWAATHELEDNFLSNLKPNRVTGEIEPSPDTINAVATFGEKNPKDIANNQFLGKLLNVADPQGAPGLVGDMTNISQQSLAAKQFKPTPMAENPEIARLQALLSGAKKASSDVPVLPNPQMGQLEAQLAQAKAAPINKPIGLPNPETTKLETALEQAKAVKRNSPNIEGVDVNAADPNSLNNELMNLLPKFSRGTGDDVAEKKLTQIMNFLRKNKGNDFANGVKDELVPLNKDIALRNMNSRSVDRDVPTSFTDAASKLLGGTTSNVANKLGRVVNKSQGAINATTDFLQNGVGSLSSANQEQLSDLASKMAQAGGKSGEAYAKVLSETQGKNSVSKNAIMMGLMQQPEFRALYHKVTGEQNGDESGK